VGIALGAYDGSGVATVGTGVGIALGVVVGAPEAAQQSKQFSWNIKPSLHWQLYPAPSTTHLVVLRSQRCPPSVHGCNVGI
jgi:hypothetical protein